MTVPSPTVAELRQSAIQRLRRAGVESPLLDAGVLLAHVLECPRHQLVLEPERQPSSAQILTFERLLEGRCQRVPVAYLTRTKEFFGLDFSVGPGVLVPRPDSETLVELALEMIPEKAPWRILDVGTGSGCLAASVAHFRPQAHVFALELSPEALALASQNLTPNPARAPGGVPLIQGNLLSCLRNHSLDLLLSNPPYVDPNTAPTLAPELGHEPEGALFAAHAGLACIERLLPQALRVLRPGGHLLLEHGFDQGEATRTLAKEFGLTEVHTVQDLARRDRCLVARCPESTEIE
jgi:release factor glutamine methyltransferase